jgi:hypothetical protein
MKIKKTATPAPSFQPISFTFTIETKKELVALLAMSRFNVSIPELVSDYEHQEIICKFLGMIQETLID